MTNTLPQPPVPPECNMAGNDWFPLYFQRLRKSKWWRRASDMARARNVMLWGEAYQQTPAGSMPDDDDDLAEAAGFGMDVDAFLTAKDEIMSAWSLCSDGRWYHPTICEVVLDAWEKVGEKRKKEALRKAEQRAKTRAKAAENTAPIADVPRDISIVPRDTPEKVGLSHDISAQREQTGEDRQDKKEANASMSTVVDESPEYPEAFEACWKAYPHIRGRSSKKLTFAQWRRIPPARRTALPLAVARYARDGREPKNDCGAPAMERWLKDERFMSWLEAPQEAAPQLIPVFTGPPALRAKIAKVCGEEFAAKYVDSATWQADPPTLIPRTGYGAAKLHREADPILRDLGVAIADNHRTAA